MSTRQRVAVAGPSREVVCSPVPAITSPTCSNSPDSSVYPVSKLEGINGITGNDTRKLADAGFQSVQSVAFAPKKKIQAIHGFSEIKADKIIAAASGFAPMGFTTASEVFRTRNDQLYITTGSKNLDGILGGSGVETGSIVSFWGESKAGKSQIAMALSVNVQLPVHRLGCEAKAAYIFTTPGNFSTERLIAMAEGQGLDPKTVMDNIFQARAFSVDHLVKLLDQIAGLMLSHRIGLLVIDTIVGLFRVDYSGRGELSERQQHLAQVLRKLHDMCNVFKVCVILTNDVCANVSGAVFSGPTNLPIGGNILAHAAVTTLRLRKGHGSERIATITSSPNLPEGEAKFTLTPFGIGDPTD